MAGIVGLGDGEVACYTAMCGQRAGCCFGKHTPGSVHRVCVYMCAVT